MTSHVFANHRFKHADYGVDTFLPFDLECGFCAAFVLILASRVCPRIVPTDHSVQVAKQIIQSIATQGNSQANLRKLEVEELEDLLHQRSQPVQQDEVVGSPDQIGGQGELWNSPDMAIPFFDEWCFDAGLSGTQIMDLAAALDTEHFDSLSQ